VLEAALTATAGTTSSMELTPLMSAAVFALNVGSTSDGEWRETAKARGAGLHGLHGADRDHPVVTRKDSLRWSRRHGVAVWPR
jgi:hypothetical protein